MEEGKNDEATDQPIGGDRISLFKQWRNGDKLPSPPPAEGGEGAAELKARQRKGLYNLSVSSRPRVPSYAIGRDRGEE
jgi:hypothetical protein